MSNAYFTPEEKQQLLAQARQLLGPAPEQRKPYEWPKLHAHQIYGSRDEAMLARLEGWTNPNRNKSGAGSSARGPMRPGQRCRFYR
jgi:hypothetical protein